MPKIKKQKSQLVSANSPIDNIKNIGKLLVSRSVKLLTDTSNKEDNSTEKPFVVLIHGLHQTASIMMPLARYLQKNGFNTHQHNYHSLKESIEQHSNRLNDWLSSHHNPNIAIHLVGHSLGGLVIRDFIHRFPQWTIAHCVTLGTPHLGSTTAHYSKRLTPFLIGHAYDNALDGQSVSLKEDIRLGVIAGNVPHGLGQLFLNYHSKKTKLSALESTHDGTVYLTETQLPDASDHITLPVSHTGMLINKQVAKQTVYFLHHGHFDHSMTNAN